MFGSKFRILSIVSISLSGDGVFAVSLGELDCLAAPLAQVIKLGPPCFAASDWFDVDNVGRMQRKDSLDALVGDDPPDREVFVDAAAFAGDNRAGEYLRSLFVALSDPAVNLDDITYLEVRDFFLERLALDGV
jgi:hypothetical protein